MITRRWIALGGLLALSPLPMDDVRQQRPAGPRNAAELGAVVDSLMAAEMASGHIPGAVFIFVQSGRVLFSKGYGWARLDPRMPVSPDSTVWRLGSISKAFTGLAVSQLADRGTIDLDADVNRYLRKVRVPATFPEPVTARHLITHTAGFDEIRPGTQSADSAGMLPLADFLELRLRRLWSPGRVLMYSTYGISLGGLLVEDVTGLSYDEYLRRNVWAPLGMTRTGVTGPRAFGDHMAQGYEWDGNASVPARWEWYHSVPASSINATARDMGRFMIALLDTVIFSRRGSTEFQRRHFAMHPRLSGVAHGLWEEHPAGYTTGRILMHGGNMEGFATDMVLLPELGQGWFVANHVESSRLRQRLREVLYHRFYRHPDSVAPAPRPLSPPSPVADYAGDYGWNTYCHTCPGGEPFSRVTVQRDSDGVLSFIGQRWIETAPDFFVRADGKDSVAFIRDSTRRITHFAWGGWAVFERLPR